MAPSTFSTGHDTQIVVVTPQGRLDLPYITSFESRQVTQSVRVSCIDGVQLGTELPRGWDGHFELERGNSAVEDFIASVEQIYYQNGPYPISTLYQYVTESDGSTSTYQYDNVTFRLSNAGQWRGDGAVKQKLEFYSSRRIRV